jgi:autotransporter-associated beta strand protein
MDFGTAVGTFPTVNLPALGGGLSWNTSQLYTTGVVSIISGGPANLTWNNTGGSGDGATWDITTNQNWNDGSAPALYHDGDNVTFTDTNNGHYAVMLNTVVSPGSVTVNNSGGDYTISGTGAIAGSGGLTKSGTGTLTISTANTYTGNTSVSGGTLTIDPAGTVASANVTVASGATLNAYGSLSATANVTANGPANFGAPGSTVASTQQLASLTIGSGVTASITPSTIGVALSAKTLQPAAMTLMDPTSKINLTDNTLVAPEPSLAAAVSLIHTTGQIFTTTPGLFVGYNDAGSGNVKFRATILGDTDLNGNVNVADLGNLATNFNKTGVNWIQGDFDYNGNVNVADLGDLATNFNKTLSGVTGTSASGAAADGAAPAAVVAGGASAVPEPASLALAAFAALGLHGRRQRRCIENRVG